MILIFAAALTAPSPSPSPSATPPPDVCGGIRSNLLAVMDRPSIGYSPCAVKAREFLAEAGWTSNSGSSGFLRYGLAPNFEADAIAGGAADSGIGMKYEWWHDGSRALATDFLYTAPTGTAAFSAGAPTETLNLDYAMPLSGNFALATTLGAQSTHNGARFFTWLPSVVVSDQWSPRAQAFVEAFAQSRTRPDGGSQLGLDAAFQYVLTPDIELDIETGRTISDATRSHYIGFGFGARF